MLWRTALCLGLWLLLAVCLMALSVPLVLALPVAALVFLPLRRRRVPGKLVALILIFGFGVFAAEAVLRLNRAAPTYYRPHEILQGHGIPYYRANQSVADFTIPHGDIAVLWPDMPPEVREPRIVRFATDSLGLRNDADYEDQPYVAVGDSFVVASGSDQDDTLSNVLTRVHGVATYNAGFPSGPASYGGMFRDVVDGHASSARAIVLIFEGNDLLCPADRLRFRPDRAWWNYVPGEVRRLDLYPLSYDLSRRAIAKLTPWGSEPGFVRTVGGQPMAFFAPYAAVSRTESGEGCDWQATLESIAAFADRIALLVFVPTKYRIYAPLIAGELDAALPNPRRDFLAAFARAEGLDFLDLTPSLSQAAAEGLGSGRYVYWRDDTHWAPAGIAAGASSIAEAIGSAAAARP